MFNKMIFWLISDRSTLVFSGSLGLYIETQKSEDYSLGLCLKFQTEKISVSVSVSKVQTLSR